MKPRTPSQSAATSEAAMLGRALTRRAGVVRPLFPRWTRFAMKIGALAAVGGVVLFAAGFLVFATSVSTLSPPERLEADGIVALTGGAERVSGAIELLSGGAARRLLISGVHPDTSAHQIVKVVDARQTLFDCCVDLDRRAANTIGNAMETAKWTQTHGFRSLIVVTSAYHMPRALAELSHVMPDVRLVAYPIAKNRLALDRWYESSDAAALLLMEYVKYIATRVRLSISAGTDVPAVLATVAP